MSRIRTNLITNRMANGAPTVSNGLVISGVTTVTTLDLNGDLDVDGHLNADNVSIAGVVTATTFSGSGASLTNLDASDLASGTVPTARLGSGTANNTTFLRGDSTFATVTSTTINNNADNKIITGSGTANTLEAESTLLYSNPNLEINTDTSPYACLILNGNSGGLVQFEDNETSKWQIFGDSAINIYDDVNNASRLYIDSSGRIGIGDNSPDRDLVVKNASSNSTIKIESSNSHTSQLFFSDTDAENVARIGVYHGSGQSTSNGMSFDLGGSLRMLINSSGNIKIGESNSGNVAFSLVTNGSGMLLSKGTTGNPSNGQTLGDIGFNAYSDSQTTSSADALIRGQAAGNFSGSSAPTDLLFFTKPAATGPGSAPTERMRINSNGQVTQSAQPSFAAYKNAGSYGLNNQIFPLDSVRHNIGSHYNTSNYRFTAPVSGRYLFTFYSILNSTVNSGHYEIRINNNSGSGQSNHFTTVNSHWDHVSSSHLLNLSANDYVTMWSNSSVGWHGGSWQLFCGELLS